jgi:cytochrome c-type biogenesis protein CcmH
VKPRMIRRKRSPFHIALLASAALFAAWLSIHPAPVLGQMQHTSTGLGTVKIENEVERQLFWSLICHCGCPRETLGTCTCEVASGLRAEMREMLAEGKTVEQAQDVYVARFGSKYLAVPRDQGANRALWAIPIVLILAGAGFVVVIVRRWRRRGDEIDRKRPAAEPIGGERDKYDDKLDDELKELDNE